MSENVETLQSFRERKEAEYQSVIEVIGREGLPCSVDEIDAADSKDLTELLVFIGEQMGGLVEDPEANYYKLKRFDFLRAAAEEKLHFNTKFKHAA